MQSILHTFYMDQCLIAQTGDTAFACFVHSDHSACTAQTTFRFHPQKQQQSTDELTLHVGYNYQFRDI